MPEFCMNGRNDAFTALDAFTQGYIEAMFFTESAGSQFTKANWNTPKTQEAIAEGTSDGNLPNDAGFSDLSPKSLKEIKADCRLFQRVHKRLLMQAYERAGYSEERAGHDFWLTRNGHGAGFWDRDELKADNLGRRLADACGWESRNSAVPFGEVDPCFGDDGKVYV